MGYRFDKRVVLWLLHQVVDAEAAADDIEEQLVEFGRYLKQRFVVGLREGLQLLRLWINNHLALLFVEE